VRCNYAENSAKRAGVLKPQPLFSEVPSRGLLGSSPPHPSALVLACGLRVWYAHSTNTERIEALNSAPYGWAPIKGRTEPVAQPATRYMGSRLCFGKGRRTAREVLRRRGQKTVDGQLKEVKAQLRSSSGRSSKLIKDGERIEAVVEVAGAGTLVLYVDGSGGYSLRGYPEER
jgi:hypothetical protein